MKEEDFQKIDSMIARHIGVFAESINHRLDILAEGHSMLSERIDRQGKELSERIGCVEHKLDIVADQADRTEKKLDSVEAKLDSVAADLKAHRADTEAHPALYGVKEP